MGASGLGMPLTYDKYRLVDMLPAKYASVQPVTLFALNMLSKSKLVPSLTVYPPPALTASVTSAPEVGGTTMRRFDAA